MGLIFVDDDVIYVDSESLRSVMYFNGSIYHNAKSTDSEIMIELDALTRDKDILVRQAAMISLIHKTMDMIREKYCQ
jgi:hypothetical protein